MAGICRGFVSDKPSVERKITSRANDNAFGEGLWYN